MTNKKTLAQIKTLQRRLKTHMASANMIYVEVEEILTFDGFGDRTPQPWTTSSGDIMLTYADVNFYLSDLYPCIMEYGHITRDYIESLTANQLLSRY